MIEIGGAVEDPPYFFRIILRVKQIFREMISLGSANYLKKSKRVQ